MVIDAQINNAMKISCLFCGIAPEAYDKVLTCLDGRRRQYRKSEQIHNAGDKLWDAGLVLCGNVVVALCNKAGNQLSINHLEPGTTFGESFVCLQTEKCPVSIYAATDCEIIRFNPCRLFLPQKKQCVHAVKVTENLVRLLAEKNVFLKQKVQILAQKKIRDRIKIFMQNELANNRAAGEPGHYVIRFSRDEMARYLGVDRSALSRTLCNLRDEGILLFEGNRIKLLDSLFLSEE